MRILWVSDFPYMNSAYAKVSKYLIPLMINDGFDVIQLPTPGLVQGHLNIGWKILPTYRSVEDIAYWFYKYDCDVAIILKDPYGVQGVKNLAIFYVGYFPLSEEPPPIEWLEEADFAIEVWLPSRWSVEQVVSAGLSRDKVFYVPHGVNTTIFKPLPNRDEVKYKLKLHDVDVVIGIVAVNRLRKVLPWQIEGVKIFAENNRDLKVVLYLHTSLEPDGIIHGGWLIQSLIKNMKLSEVLYDVRITDPNMYIHGFTEEEMAMLYNVFDVLLNCSTEGFGMTVLEAQSSGCPVITLNHGACPEINFLNLNVKVQSKLYTVRGSWWGIPDPYDIADKISKAISFNREKISKLLHEKAKEFDWINIYEKYLRYRLYEIMTKVTPIIVKVKK